MCLFLLLQAVSGFGKYTAPQYIMIKIQKLCVFKAFHIISCFVVNFF